MVPVLYDYEETEFITNGLGRLTDCISCKVTEERNGIYECEFEYPLTGEKYDLIRQGNIVLVSHDDTGDLQPFVIYRRSAPMRGVVTFNANHISYQLSNVILKPFTASGVVEAFSKFKTETMTPQMFDFWTDKTTEGSFKVNVPSTAKSMLGGVAGSILDTYGGEYEWDRFTVKLHLQRGENNGVTIRYGKNLIDLKQVHDSLGLYNTVVPYWKNDDSGEVVYGNLVHGVGGFEETKLWTDENGSNISDQNGNDIAFFYFRPVAYVMDLSSEFNDKPTVKQLEEKALSLVNKNEPWNPSENLTVNFLALWQTEEYKNIAPLERVKLCDTVTIIYEELGVRATSKVNKVVWNVLTEKYNSVELGSTQASLSQSVAGSIKDTISNLPTIAMLDAAIGTAKSILSGENGGNVLTVFDSQSRPTAILIMDSVNMESAKDVLRLNGEGIALSQNGVSGQYKYILRFSNETMYAKSFESGGSEKWFRIINGILTGGQGNDTFGTLELSEDGGGVSMTAQNGMTLAGNTVRVKPGAGGVEVFYNSLPQGIAVGSDGSRGMPQIKKVNLVLENNAYSVIAEDTDGELYRLSATKL